MSNQSRLIQMGWNPFEKGGIFILEMVTLGNYISTASVPLRDVIIARGRRCRQLYTYLNQIGVIHGILLQAYKSLFKRAGELLPQTHLKDSMLVSAVLCSTPFPPVPICIVINQSVSQGYKLIVALSSCSPSQLTNRRGGGFCSFQD